jgi:glycosyltransferase involved in cell wall biosynthesis
MKPFVVVQGPVATRSGYGNHTRDLVTSLIKSDKYDIQIVSLPWGNTPMDALEPNNVEHQEIMKRVAMQNITRQPDVFIQVSIPNEFQPHGKYNIGVTAGIETDQVSPEFLEGCNRMNLILTTSEHSKQGFLNSTYEKRDKNTNQPIGTLRLEKPIEVLFEGVDLNLYTKTNDVNELVLDELNSIKEGFNFLFVGHWLKGDLGADRKDIGMLIKTFCESFKNKATQNKPGLILKTSHATFSIIDREEIIKKINMITAPYGKSAPSIYLLHGDLTDEQMNSLYNHPKVKAMVSFTHGEGYGRPLLEFTLSEKPVIASNWSGHIDFLKHATLLPGEVKEVHQSATDNWIVKGSKWFTVNYGYAISILRDVVDNYKTYLNTAKRQAYVSRTDFSLDKMAEKFCEYVNTGVNSVPTQVQLQLPKLKKVEETTETPKITLPKLKKVEV